MWGWLKALSEGVLTALASAISDWWRAEEAEAAKSKAKAIEHQLDSVKEGLAIQAEMARKTAEASSSTPSSGAGWNASRVVPVILLGIFLQGCGLFRIYVYTEPYQPVPPAVERPVLEDESAFNPREQVLAGYASELEAALAEARAYAIEQNQQQGYPVDPADAEWLRAYRNR